MILLVDILTDHLRSLPLTIKELMINFTLNNIGLFELTLYGQLPWAQDKGLVLIPLVDILTDHLRSLPLTIKELIINFTLNNIGLSELTLYGQLPWAQDKGLVLIPLVDILTDHLRSLPLTIKELIINFTLNNIGLSELTLYGQLPWAQDKGLVLILFVDILTDHLRSLPLNIKELIINFTLNNIGLFELTLYGQLPWAQDKGLVLIPLVDI